MNKPAHDSIPSQNDRRQNPPVKLTDTRITNWKPERDDEYLKDTESKLQVRGRLSGSKTFYFRSNLRYQTIKIQIGEYGPVKLPDARDKAIIWQGWIEEGKDPREVMKEQDRERAAAVAAKLAAEQAAALEAARREITALEVWQVYIAARTPKWSASTIHDHARTSQEGGKPITRGRRSGPEPFTQPGILRPLLRLPLTQLTADRVAAWLKIEAARRPTQAALAYRLLRGFLNWCASHPDYAGSTQQDVCGARSVREEVPRKRAKDDVLQREQLKAWFAKVRQIPNPIIATFLQISLLTGARREELLELKWADVNFQWKTLHIADKVEEGGRTLPLTPYCLALLRELQARNATPPPLPRSLRPKEAAARPAWQPSPWVFASPTAASGRLQDPRIQHKAACEAAGIEGLTIHGLRRSFGTLSEWVECPVGVAAQIMGHKPSATAEKHYRRRPVDLLRLWHTKIEGWVLEQADITQPQTEQAPVLRAVG
ncbi:MAG: integrase family protein [Chromatiaceae bacterium]|nr:integrase family protein [Chromatiaceae bacterium]